MYQESHNRLKEEMMNIENLKTKAEADISEYITKKLLNLRKRPGKKLPVFSLPHGKNDGS